MSNSSTSANPFRSPARIIAALLVIAGVVLVAVALLGSSAAASAEDEAKIIVANALEAAELAEDDLADAEAALATAQTERESAEFEAAIAKGSYSFLHSKAATQAFYEGLMEEAANAYDKVDDAKMAAEADSDNANRELTLATSSRRSLTDVAESASSRALLFAGISVVLLIAAVVFWFLFGRTRKTPHEA